MNSFFEWKKFNDSLFLLLLCVYSYSMAELTTDKHPEKRLKALFKAYEAANLPRIKAENPSLRLSQWKQILFKEWQKSPDNPLNAVN